jgi:methionine synthase II (cobalamin-independent)
MRKERVSATVEVAKRLFEAEAALDRAVKATAELSACMTSARIDASLSAVVGQDALQCAAGSLNALVSARQQLVETHLHLDEVKTKIGLRELALGGGMAKPTSRHLHAVNEAA